MRFSNGTVARRPPRSRTTQALVSLPTNAAGAGQSICDPITRTRGRRSETLWRVHLAHNGDETRPLRGHGDHHLWIYGAVFNPRYNGVLHLNRRMARGANNASIRHGDIAIVVDRLLWQLHEVARPDPGLGRDIQSAGRSLEHRDANDVTNSKNQIGRGAPISEHTRKPLGLILLKHRNGIRRHRHEVVGDHRRVAALNGARCRTCHGQGRTACTIECRSRDQNPDATLLNQHESPLSKLNELPSLSINALELSVLFTHRLQHVNQRKFLPKVRCMTDLQR